jgi:hypothetical protein
VLEPSGLLRPLERAPSSEHEENSEDGDGSNEDRRMPVVAAGVVVVEILELAAFIRLISSAGIDGAGDGGGGVLIGDPATSVSPVDSPPNRHIGAGLQSSGPSCVVGSWGEVGVSGISARFDSPGLFIK